mmetsp:Transcript_50616/g.99575  ORF Transcript_50616/g.99575 Transcript_50616/m.99575 type:complete len:257 (-) Transcript_50616:1382-2152(-)
MPFGGGGLSALLGATSRLLRPLAGEMVTTGFLSLNLVSLFFSRSHLIFVVLFTDPTEPEDSRRVSAPVLTTPRPLVIASRAAAPSELFAKAPKGGTAVLLPMFLPPATFSLSGTTDDAAAAASCAFFCFFFFPLPITRVKPSSSSPAVPGPLAGGADEDEEEEEEAPPPAAAAASPPMAAAPFCWSPDRKEPNNCCSSSVELAGGLSSPSPSAAPARFWPFFFFFFFAPIPPSFAASASPCDGNPFLSIANISVDS